MDKKIAKLGHLLGLNVQEIPNAIDIIRLLLHEPVILTGNGCQEIAKNVSEILEFKLIKTTIKKFNNGEPDVVIDETVRGKIGFFIQTFRTGIVNDDMADTEAIADAFRRAGGKEIHIVSLIFPGERQDRRENDKKRSRPKRRPITAKGTASKFEKWFDSVITVHLHSEQIEGFFDKIPIENLNVINLFRKEFKQMGILTPESFVLVSPDVGGTKYVSDFAHALGCEYAICDKQRTGPGQSEVRKLVGDVNGKIAIMLDDQIDTGTTLCKAVDFVLEKGATRVIVGCTHYVGSDGATEKLLDSNIEKIIVTDTIPTEMILKYPEKFKVLSIAPIIASVIAAQLENKSLENTVAMRIEEAKEVATQ